jgi:glycosyltransferase involved in cell wall biosynthesis
MPWLIQGVPVFSVGQLSQKYGRQHLFSHTDVQTTLSAADIRDDACGVFSQPLRLLFVGRLAIEKGLNYLVDAVSLCKTEGLDLELTIVGDGDERKLLESLVEKQNLQHFVDFKGFIPLGEALQAVYRRADVFVLPSTSEGMPKVLLEAMANGLVVIASRVGGIPTLVRDGVNGLLVEPRSSVAIARAIRKIATAPVESRILVENGLRTAKRYTIEEQTQHTLIQLKHDFSALGWMKSEY